MIERLDEFSDHDLKLMKQERFMDREIQRFYNEALNIFSTLVDLPKEKVSEELNKLALEYFDHDFEDCDPIFKNFTNLHMFAVLEDHEQFEKQYLEEMESCNDDYDDLGGFIYL